MTTSEQLYPFPDIKSVKVIQDDNPPFVKEWNISSDANFVQKCIIYASKRVELVYSTTAWKLRTIDISYFAYAILMEKDDYATTISRVLDIHMCIDQKVFVESNKYRKDFTQPKLRSMPLLDPPNVSPELMVVDDVEFKYNTFGEGAIKSLGVTNILKIGVLGNLREGKSTLLNFFLEFLGGNGIGSNTRFDTSSGVDSKTKGCSFIAATSPLSSYDWVILVDFEGLSDPAKPYDVCHVYDIRLFALAAQILDVVVFNFKGCLNNDLLEKVSSLELVSNILAGEKNLDSGNKAHLMLCLRDFELPDSGINAIAKYEAQIMKYKQVNCLFESVTIHGLPFPVTNARLLKKKQVSSMNKEELAGAFVEALQSLFNDIFRLKTKCCLNGIEMSRLLNSAIPVINSGSIEPLNLAAAFVVSKLDGIMETVLQDVEASSERIRKKFPCDEKPFENYWTIVQSSAETVFKGNVAEFASKSSIDRSAYDYYMQVKQEELSNFVHQVMEVSNYQNVVKCRYVFSQNTKVFESQVDENRSKFTYPQDANTLEVMVETFIAQQQKELRGPEVWKHSTLKAFKTIWDKQIELYRTSNLEISKRKNVEASITNNMIKHRRKMDGLATQIAQSKNREQVVKMKLEEVYNDLSKQLKLQAEASKTEMDTRTREFERTLAFKVAEARSTTEQDWKHRQNSLKKELDFVKHELDRQRHRAEDLQRRINDHKCDNGCIVS